MSYNHYVGHLASLWTTLKSELEYQMYTRLQMTCTCVIHVMFEELYSSTIENLFKEQNER